MTKRTAIKTTIPEFLKSLIIGFQEFMKGI